MFLGWCSSGLSANEYTLILPELFDVLPSFTFNCWMINLSFGWGTI